LVGANNLANGPDWTQIQIQASNQFQWNRDGGGGGGQGGGQGGLFMLNADIAIVRDFDDSLDVGGEVSCTFRFPVEDRCPLAATLTKAGVYRNNNDEWLDDFKEVLILMLEKGL